MDRTATCCCEQLRVHVVGEPDRVIACNCLECQRRTGTAFGLAAYFPQEQVVSVEGRSASFSRAAGALKFDTSFCPNCGTSVLWRSSALPNHVAVGVGCFADPSVPGPTVVAWTSEKHAWVRFPDPVPSTPKSAFE
jgi:hypothetical protein